MAKWQKKTSEEKKEANEAKAAETLKDIETMMAGEELPDILEKTFFPDYEAPCNSYSPLNRALIYMKGTADARTNKQWYNTKRTIVKGSKGIRNWRPFLVNRKLTTGEKTLLKKVQDELKQQKILIGFYPFYTFRYEDTDGEPLAEMEEIEKVTFPKLEAVAAALGIKVEKGPQSSGTFWGFFSPTEGKIKVETDNWQTFAHELGHAVDDYLLKEQTGEGLQNGQDPVQEAVAELTATLLSRVYNMGDYEANAYKYIKQYAGDSHIKTLGMVSKVFNRVQKVAAFIMDVVDEIEDEEQPLFSSLKKTELVSIAKENGIKGYSTMSKPQLVIALA